MSIEINNVRIKTLRPIISPALLCEKYPLSSVAMTTVLDARTAIENIISGDDSRFLVVVGPCSIHDVDAAIEYAGKLKNLAGELSDQLMIVMRVYFEKPRTTSGWKGLINDPLLDNSFDINLGLKRARKLLLDLANMGLPSGTEFLDSIIPQYLADTISWGAIGARTTESQVHRELASGLSMPIGFKNGTDGNVQIAVDAMGATRLSHHFLSINEYGSVVIVTTQGNPQSHVILRGAHTGPNYDADSVALAGQMLEKSGSSARIMIDCSHGNSEKDHEKQKGVVRNVAQQIASGNKTIFGVMLESFLVGGKQKIGSFESMQYGQSVTDACLGWEDTLQLLRELARTVKEHRQG